MNHERTLLLASFCTVATLAVGLLFAVWADIPRHVLGGGEAVYDSSIYYDVAFLIFGAVILASPIPGFFLLRRNYIEHAALISIFVGIEMVLLAWVSINLGPPFIFGWLILILAIAATIISYIVFYALFVLWNVALRWKLIAAIGVCLLTVTDALVIAQR